MLRCWIISNCYIPIIKFQNIVCVLNFPLSLPIYLWLQTYLHFEFWILNLHVEPSVRWQLSWWACFLKLVFLFVFALLVGCWSSCPRTISLMSLLSGAGPSVGCLLYCLDFDFPVWAQFHQTMGQCSPSHSKLSIFITCLVKMTGRSQTQYLAVALIFIAKFQV